MDQPKVSVIVDFREALEKEGFIREHFTELIESSFNQDQWRRWLGQRIRVIFGKKSLSHPMVMVQLPDGELYVKVFWADGQFTHAFWELAVFFAAFRELIEGGVEPINVSSY